MAEARLKLKVGFGSEMVDSLWIYLRTTQGWRISGAGTQQIQIKSGMRQEEQVRWNQSLLELPISITGSQIVPSGSGLKGLDTHTESGFK